MADSSKPRRRRGRDTLAAVVLGVVALAFMTPAAFAQPHEEEESEFAIDLVQQAISYIANDGSPEQALEKIEDALAAPDPTGVDLALVEQAAALVEDASPAEEDAALAQAQELLLQAAPALAKDPPRGATGLDTGTTRVLAPFEPARGIRDGGDWVLLGLSAAAVALGLWLAWRWRPHHSLRELRHLDAQGSRAIPAGGRS